MSKAGYEQIGVAMTCRGYEEYRHMFDLTERDLSGGDILDVAAGGSSFTAEAREKGFNAFAVDPRYDGEVAEWIVEAAGEIEVSTAKLAKLADSFDWSFYGSIDNHRRGREASLRIFREHALSSEGAPCYHSGKLPSLPYENGRFTLVLCSHFLFLYDSQFGEDFHREAVRELMRITKPGGVVRIYPLITLEWNRYEGLDALLDFIRLEGGTPEILESRLPFIPGSEHYLTIKL